MRDLDGTPTKARLGANAIIGTSMALAARWLFRRAHLCTSGFPGSASPATARPVLQRSQRRRPRTEPARLPGVHGLPDRGIVDEGGCKGWGRGLPGPSEAPRCRRPRHRTGRRGWLRSEPRRARGGPRPDRLGDRGRRLPHRPLRRCDRAGPGRVGVSTRTACTWSTAQTCRAPT